MTLQRWALTLLTSEDLPSKLAPPIDWTDAPTPVELPLAPARPMHLRPSASREDFPRQFHDPRERGRALHFFANHELLAIELMALALLRFTDAVPAWRRTLARVITEEQLHFQLYWDRMRALGVELGEVPVNDTFWRTLAPIADREQFIAAMALTFEQANLDHCVHYAQVFRDSGDSETASLLDRIHADEIRHVAHGIHWAQAGDDLWSWWTKRLVHPLTPARAKGAIFDRPGRQKAGFLVNYIDQLELYSHSRGRPPDLWTFDPHHEGALLGQSPNAIATRLEHDLSSLLIFLAKADDVVLVPTLPSEAHLRTLQAAGIRLPRLLSPTSAPDYRQIGRVRAWGANSYAEERLSAWNAIAQQPLRTHPRQRTLASKAFALELFQSTFSDEERLVPRDQRGKMCTTLEDVLAAARTLPRPLLKAPLSTAGRDRIRSPQEAWISRILREQGQVVVQPQWDRILDLSLQGRIDDGRLHIDGMTRFYTDRTGRFLGVEVGRPFEAVSADLRRFCSGGWIEAALHRSAQAFAEHAIPLGFSGFFGIDAMLVHSERGPLLHPLLEVNARNTFGRLALSFRSRVGTGTPAVWRLFRREDSVPPMVPLEVRHGRWVGGHLLTSEWTDNTSVGSVLAVGSHAETLRETLLPTPETISKLVD